MAVTLDGRQPVPARSSPTRSVSTSTARRCTSRRGTRSRRTRRSSGWALTSCAGSSPTRLPSQNINFGYGPAEEVKRQLLTFWNSVSFFITYANIAGSNAGGPSRRGEAARPLARRPHGPARPRRDRRVRAVLDAGRHRGFRRLLRRSVQLVHPPLSPALLGGRPRGARGALERAHDCPAGDRARDAFPGRAPVARPGLKGRVRLPRRLAGGTASGRGAAGGAGRGARRRHARPPGARRVPAEAPAAAAPARRPGSSGGRLARGRDPRTSYA